MLDFISKNLYGLVSANIDVTTMLRRPDLTNRERQARHRARRKASLMALAAPPGPADARAASPAPVDPDRLDPIDVKSALRRLSKMDRLAAAEGARAAFTAEVVLILGSPACPAPNPPPSPARPS